MSFLRRGLGDGRRPRRDDRFTSTRLPIQQGGISVPKRTPAPREKSQAHENSLFSGCGGGMARDRGGRGGRVSRAGRWLRRAWGLGRRGERGAGLAISSSISCLNVLCGLTSAIAGMTQAPHKPHTNPTIRRSSKKLAGDPKNRFQPRIWHVQLASNLWVIHRRGRQKFRRASEDLVTPQAFADPRLACSLAPSRSTAGLGSGRSGTYSTSLTAPMVRAQSATRWRHRLIARRGRRWEQAPRQQERPPRWLARRLSRPPQIWPPRPLLRARQGRELQPSAVRR